MAFNGNFMCTSFKTELLTGTHNFTNGANTFKLALYTNSATLNASTTAYGTSNEVANGNGYTTGGAALTNVTPANSGTTAFCDFSDVTYSSSTITARGALIYNDTQADKAVLVLEQIKHLLRAILLFKCPRLMLLMRLYG